MTFPNWHDRMLCPFCLGSGMEGDVLCPICGGRGELRYFEWRTWVAGPE